MHPKLPPFLDFAYSILRMKKFTFSGKWVWAWYLIWSGGGGGGNTEQHLWTKRTCFGLEGAVTPSNIYEQNVYALVWRGGTTEQLLWTKRICFGLEGAVTPSNIYEQNVYALV